MSNIFFLSDSHFNHKKVISYSQRPFSSVEEMDEQLIANWNKIVKDNNIIYHLGDVSFGNKEYNKKLFSRLNGQKHLILGNHDNVKNLSNQFGISYFSSVQHYKELKINNQLLVLFHYGQRVWNKSHYNSIHLYGHSHGKLPPYGKSVDVGVDCKEITDEYRPIHLDEIFNYMKDR